MKITFNAFLFNPVFWHIWDALHNPRIRRILVRGGSSAGKTGGVCDAINLYQLSAAASCLALRKHRVHVDTTIKPSFEMSIARRPEISHLYQKMEGEIRVATGAETKYGGMDDPEKIKGLESYDILYYNELNQFEPGEWSEGDRRLRGRPNQKIIADWNPIIITHWINQEILSADEGWIDLPLDLPEYEKEYGAFTQLTPPDANGLVYAFKRINATGDTLWINVTYRDNYWIVGHPAGPEYGFIDQAQLQVFERMKVKKPNEYRIYGMGQDGIIKTGGELWKQFDEARHTRDLEYTPGSLIHISLDKNVVPYCTASIWQAVELEGDQAGTWELRQIAEVASRAPNNTAFKNAMEVGKYLERINYKGDIAVYGDPSAKNRSTEDDEGRSHFDKFISTMDRLGYRVINRVEKSAPRLLLSVSFVNDIYEELIEGWRIVIGKSCQISIEDYNLLKEGPDGKPLKELTKKDPDNTLQRFQKYGHFSDAKRYFIITILRAIFDTYKQRSGRARIMSQKE